MVDEEKLDRLAPPIRVVLAKIGLDGHDRGIKVVARALRDAGMEVIYTGLWQTPEEAVRAVEDEDAQVLGISLLSGTHLALAPQVLNLLRRRGLDHVKLVIGGIIPDDDVPQLKSMGVSEVFSPGASLEAIAAGVIALVADD
jgi:methylmalonyl-CoA mutase C-terminal domain/subunit